MGKATAQHQRGKSTRPGQEEKRLDRASATAVAETPTTPAEPRKRPHPPSPVEAAPGVGGPVTQADAGGWEEVGRSHGRPRRARVGGMVVTLEDTHVEVCDPVSPADETATGGIAPAPHLAPATRKEELHLGALAEQVPASPEFPQPATQPTRPPSPATSLASSDETVASTGKHTPARGGAGAKVTASQINDCPIAGCTWATYRREVSKVAIPHLLIHLRTAHGGAGKRLGPDGLQQHLARRNEAIKTTDGSAAVWMLTSKQQKQMYTCPRCANFFLQRCHQADCQAHLPEASDGASHQGSGDTLGAGSAEGAGTLARAGTAGRQQGASTAKGHDKSRPPQQQKQPRGRTGTRTAAAGADGSVVDGSAHGGEADGAALPVATARAAQLGLAPVVSAQLLEVASSIPFPTIFTSTARTMVLAPMHGTFQQPWIQLVEAVAAKVLEASSSGEEEGRAARVTAAVKLLLLLPKFLLAKPLGDVKSADKLLHDRVSVGDITAKITGFLGTLASSPAERLAPPAAGDTASPGSATPTLVEREEVVELDSPELAAERLQRRKANQARRLATEGSLSKATARLDPNAAPIARLDENGMEALRALHPATARTGIDRETPAPVPGLTRQPLPLDLLARALRNMDRSAAAGPTGWSRRLCPQSGSLPKLTNLMAVVGLLGMGLLPLTGEALQFLGGGSIVPLTKRDAEGKNVGVRPIVLGEFLLKWAGKALMIQHESAITRILLPADQHGVGIKGGQEHIVHAIKAYRELASLAGETDTALLQVDFTNAYNTISRSLVRRALLEAPDLHGLLPYFDTHYPLHHAVQLGVSLVDGQQGWIPSEEGVHQGDPLGPAFFALGLALVTARAKGLTAEWLATLTAGDRAHMEQPALSAYFLDDGTHLGRWGLVLRQLLHLRQAAAELHSGLHINVRKSLVWGLGAAATTGTDLRQLAMELGFHELQVVPEDQGVVVLGVPVGPAAMVRDHHTHHFETQIRPLLKNLHRIGSTQLLMLLLRYCAVPKLNHILRTTETELLTSVLDGLDDEVTATLRAMVDEPLTGNMRTIASLPFRMGGLGLTRAKDVAGVALMASVAAAVPALEELPAFQYLMAKVATPGTTAQQSTPEATATQQATLPTVASAASGGTPAPLRLNTSLVAAARRTHDQLWKELEKTKVAEVRRLHSSSESPAAPAPGWDKQVPWMEKKLTAAARPLPRTWEHLFYREDNCGGGTGSGRGRKVQHAYTEAVHSLRLWKLYHTMSSPHDKARLVSQSCAGASDWLQAVPFEAELRITDRDMQWSLTRWMGSPLALEADAQAYDQCPLCSRAPIPADANARQFKGQHALNCPHGGKYYRRHDTIRDTLAAMFRDAGLQVQVEARGLLPGTGSGGPDLLVHGFPLPSQRSAVEVTVTNPAQHTTAKHAAVRALVASAAKHAAKYNKYDEATRDAGVSNLPAVLETTGALSPQLQELLVGCGKVAEMNVGSRIHQACAMWSVSTPARYWRQRISVVLHRALAAVNTRMSYHDHSHRLHMAKQRPAAGKAAAAAATTTTTGGNAQPLGAAPRGGAASTTAATKAVPAVVPSRPARPSRQKSYATVTSAVSRV